MALTYHHLDEPDVREQMVGGWTEEYATLCADGMRQDCYGRQLTAAGWQAYAEHMLAALASHNDDWLVAAMDEPAYWEPYMRRHRRSSGYTLVNYNKRDALERLCIGEFNVAYVRGLARALKLRGETHCVVYRAGSALEPRGECTGWEGKVFDLDTVLAGHRARYFPPPGRRDAWSIPTGPNCHHSIRAMHPTG